MKFKIEVRDERSGPWWETFDIEGCTDEARIRGWALATIKSFNDSLRPGESPRSFVGGIEIIDEGTKHHKWTKQNLGTKADHRGTFDLMKCAECGCTGRRYGLGELGIKRSAEFKAKKWVTCPGATAANRRPAGTEKR